MGFRLIPFRTRSIVWRLKDRSYAALLERLGVSKESDYKEDNIDEDSLIWIEVYDSDSSEVVDRVLFMYELYDVQGEPQIKVTNFERMHFVDIKIKFLLNDGHISLVLV